MLDSFLLGAIALEGAYALWVIQRPVSIPEAPEAPPHSSQPVSEASEPTSAPESAIHEVIELQADGNHIVKSRHHAHEGITPEIKHALKTPGLAVRWGHGKIESGRE